MGSVGLVSAYRLARGLRRGRRGRRGRLLLGLRLPRPLRLRLRLEDVEDLLVLARHGGELHQEGQVLRRARGGQRKRSGREGGGARGYRLSPECAASGCAALAMGAGPRAHAPCCLLHSLPPLQRHPPPYLRRPHQGRKQGGREKAGREGREGGREGGRRTALAGIRGLPGLAERPFSPKPSLPGTASSHTSPERIIFTASSTPGSTFSLRARGGPSEAHELSPSLACDPCAMMPQPPRRGHQAR